MDRFKFRAWNKDKACFFHWDLTMGFNGTSDIWGPAEQCTGLKDKNGRLIYEGDILQGYDEWRQPDCVYVVVWNQDYCTFNAMSNDERYNSFAFCRNERWKDVVGNIHDNPEGK